MAERLEHMRPVAAQYTVLVVPELPAIAIGQVGRADEAVGVVDAAGVVLVEVAGIAAAHVGGVQIAALAAPFELERRLPVAGVGVVKLGDDVA